MSRIMCVSAVMLVAASAPAFSQTADQGSGQFPGVDISRTLNPRPTTAATQTANVALPTSTVSPIAPTSPSSVGGPGPTPYVIGGASVTPSVTVGRFYDDNVFAASTGRLSDFATFVRPEVSFKLNDTGNATILGGGYVERRFYDRFSSEEQTNGAAALSGTYAVDRDTQLVGRLQYLHSHEDRGSVESQFQQFNKPIAFDQIDAAGAVNKRYDRWYTSVGAAGLVVKYENPTINGIAISQDYRNGGVVRVPARVGYVVAPLTSVFVEGAGNTRNFNVGAFDSEGYRVVGGVLFEPGPGARVKGEVFGGYMNQNYNGFGFQTVSTWTYGAAIAFLVTPDLTATFEGRRDPREASLSGGQLVGIPGDGVSVVQTVAAGRLDYLLLPNMVVSGGANYLHDRYLGAGRDQAFGPTAAFRWYFSPWVTVNLDYRNIDYSQNIQTIGGLAGAGYRRNVYLAALAVKF